MVLGAIVTIYRRHFVLYTGVNYSSNIVCAPCYDGGEPLFSEVHQFKSLRPLPKSDM